MKEDGQACSPVLVAVTRYLSSCPFDSLLVFFFLKLIVEINKFLVLYAYRRIMSANVIQALNNTNTGVGEHEIIKVKLIAFDDLYKEAPDAKALSAIALYNIYQKKNPTATWLPKDKAAEDKLMASLQKKWC